MISIDVRTDFRDVTQALNRLHSDIRDKALAAALNRTADKARTEMRTAITDEYAIKAGDVRSRLNVKRASAKGLKLVAVLEVLPGSRRGRSMNVIHFLRRQPTPIRRRHGAQLQFQFRKKGGLKQIPGTFVVTHNRGTFVASRIPGSKDIESKQVIDVPQMFNARKITARVIARINREFPIEAERAINAYLRGFVRGR